MSNEQVTQQQIEGLLVLREQAQEASTAARKKQMEVGAEEKRLMTALEAGAQVKPGAYFLLLTKETTGRSVAWRKVVERELGKAFAEKVLADTPPGEEQVLRVAQEVKAGGGGSLGPREGG